jgi:hypothetical protein
MGVESDNVKPRPRRSDLSERNEPGRRVIESVHGMLARRTERIRKRVLASCKPIVWITGVAGTGKTQILQALRKKLERGSGARVWTLLDDPDTEHLESALVSVRSADRGRQRRMVVATRPNAAAANVLRKPRVYGLVEVIEDAELFLSARDGGATGSSQVLELTGGWPVLADAFASGRAAELLHELPDFLQTEVLPTLPPSVVVALFVALSEPLSDEAVGELFRGQAPFTPLLRHTAQGLSTASTWVAGALRHLRQRPNTFSKETLDRILDLHARYGRPDRSIPALLDMGQTAQALAVFERAGGPFFGYLRGFHALQTLLDLFGSEPEGCREGEGYLPCQFIRADISAAAAKVRSRDWRRLPAIILSVGPMMTTTATTFPVASNIGAEIDDTPAAISSIAS